MKKTSKLQRPSKGASSSDAASRSTLEGDIRTQNAAMRLQSLSQSKQLDEDDFLEAMTLLSDRPNGYVGSRKRRRHDTSKIEHSAAATAALARFQNPKVHSKRTNRALLQELSVSQAGSDQVKKKQRDAAGDMNTSTLDTVSTVQPSDQSLVDYLFSNRKSAVIEGPNMLKEMGLPLAPLLNSDLQQTWIREARASKKDTPHSDELTELEQRLNVNAFAHMLASEVRMCTVTGLRLPSDLLSAFQIQLQVETGSPWLVPDNVQPERCERPFLESAGSDQSPFSLKDFSRSTQHGSSRSDGEVSDLGEPSGLPQQALESDTFEERLPEKETQDKRASIVAMPVTSNAAYITSSRATLKWLVKNRLWNTQWVPLRWWLVMKKSINSVLIRQNLPAYVEKLLRCKLVRHLASLASPQNGPHLSAFDGRNMTHDMTAGDDGVRLALEVQNEELQSVAAILWFGGEKHQKTGGSFFGMKTDYKNSKSRNNSSEMIERTIPIYDMQEMLTFNEFKWLRDASLATYNGADQGNVFKHELVVLRHDSRTVRTLGLLWLLRNFQNPFTSHRVSLRAVLPASTMSQQARKHESSTSISGL